MVSTFPRFKTKLEGIYISLKLDFSTQTYNALCKPPMEHFKDKKVTIKTPAYLLRYRECGWTIGKICTGREANDE